jgi:hypothetical protein
MKNYPNYTKFMREAEDTYLVLHRNFCEDYYELVRDTKRLLNGLVTPGMEWPSLDKVLKRFDFECKPEAIPPSDFRVSLGTDELDALNAQAERNMAEKMRQLNAEIVKRLYDVLETFRATLADRSGKDKDGNAKYKGFHDTLVTNVREVCDVLTRLNVTEDPVLERFRREAELLAVSEPETIKANEDVRIENISRAQSILDAMEQNWGKGMFV